MAITERTRNRWAAQTYARTTRTHQRPHPATMLVDLETGRIIPPQSAALVERARDRAWHVDHCPHCGRQHAHWAGKHGDDPRRFLGVVRALCGGEYPLAWGVQA